MTRMKRFAALLGLLLPLIAVQVGIAPSASASTAPVAAPLRACTDLSVSGCQRVLLTVPAGTAVTMHCWFDSSSYTGRYTSKRWFVVSSALGSGWIHSSHVVAQSSVGWCGSVERFMAGWRASRWWGQVTANGTVSSWWTPSQWAPGPVGEWSGDCVKLGIAAYHAASGRAILSGSTAYNQYTRYRDAGRVKTGVPNLGSLVFYGKTAGNSAGHVAVYVGGGMVATTQGLDKAKGPITFASYRSGAQTGAYLGWALP